MTYADMLTEENEKFVEFGIGGLSNCCLGKYKLSALNKTLNNARVLLHV